MFASGAPHPPEAYSGAECSIGELAFELQASGHLATVVAGVHGRKRSWLETARWVKSRGRPPRERGPGYTVVRSAPTLVGDVVASEIRARRPDLVVTWNSECVRIARVAHGLGVPVLVWVPDVDFARYLDALPPVTLAAASAYVAGRVGAASGRAVHVMRPLIRFDTYRSAVRAPAHVTLVTPVREKGLEVVLEVAALLPARRFALIDSWRVSRMQRNALRRRLLSLPNVTLRAPVASPAAIYRTTLLLLVPSQTEDASPRVVLEAQVNGVPVVASAVGGVPEVLGEGGLLLPRAAPPAAWAEAIEGVLSDSRTAAELIAKGHANVARPEFEPVRIATDFLTLATNVVGAAA